MFMNFFYLYGFFISTFGKKMLKIFFYMKRSTKVNYSKDSSPNERSKQTYTQKNALMSFLQVFDDLRPTVAYLACVWMQYSAKTFLECHFQYWFYSDSGTSKENLLKEIIVHSHDFHLLRFFAKKCEIKKKICDRKALKILYIWKNSNKMSYWQKKKLFGSTFEFMLTLM